MRKQVGSVQVKIQECEEIACSIQEMAFDVAKKKDQLDKLDFEKLMKSVKVCACMHAY